MEQQLARYGAIAPPVAQRGNDDVNIQFNGTLPDGREMAMKFTGRATDAVVNGAFAAATGHVEALNRAVNNACVMVWKYMYTAKDLVSHEFLMWMNTIAQVPVNYPNGVGMPQLPPPPPTGAVNPMQAQLDEMTTRLRASDEKIAQLNTKLEETTAKLSEMQIKVAVSERLADSLTKMMGTRIKDEQTSDDEVPRRRKARAAAAQDDDDEDFSIPVRRGARGNARGNGARAKGN